MIVGTMKIEKGTEVRMSSFYPNYPDTVTVIDETVEVPVEKFNSYTSYYINGVTKCPRPYNIIEDPSFTPNENFYVAFPYLNSHL